MTHKGYPDIESLPSLANFFDVTTDELLGVNKEKKQLRIQAFLDQFADQISQGNICECIRVMRIGLGEYPNSYELMCNLMYALYIACEDEGFCLEHKDEVISLGERILTYCTEDKIRLEAKRLLSSHYYDLGNKSKAKELTGSLPDYITSCQMVLPHISEGVEQLKMLQDNIATFTDALVNNIKSYVWRNEKLDHSDKIRLCMKTINLLDLIYEDEDYTFYLVRLIATYKSVAMWYAQVSQWEEALNSLERAAKYSLEYDRLPEEVSYTSTLVSKLTYQQKETHTSDKRSYARILLEDDLPQKCYDPIRDNDRFRAIEAELQEAIDDVVKQNCNTST